jgi:hypothetical protein
MRDVAGHGETAISAPALGVHAPFGNHLTVEMRQFLHEPNILKQRRTAWACRQNVGVVGNRGTRSIGKGNVIGHRLSPSSELRDEGIERPVEPIAKIQRLCRK